MSRKRIISLGTIYIVFYIITSAISNVFVNHTTRSITPVVSLFYTSLFTIIFFSILNLKELKEQLPLVKNNIKAIVWLNILNAIIWFVIFFSLKVLSPAVFACLFLGAIPINVFVLGLKTSKSSKKSNITTALLLSSIFMLMLLLVFYDIQESNYYQIVKYGFIVVFIGGITAAFIMKISKKLAVKNLSASLVVSLRFYGLLLISSILFLLNPTLFLVSPIVLAEFFVLSLFSMALPLFLLQKALKTLSPLYASILITAIPVLTYFLQLITGYYSFSGVKLGITLLFSILLTVLAYVKSTNANA